jgi:sulfoxide reductase heme-binding subunit YedZ
MTTWIILRAAGIGAYLMLFLSVSWGLLATTALLGKRVSRASATTVHQFMATCGLFLLAIHLGGLLVDSFVPFAPADLLVPMRSAFKPLPVAFGIAAMYVSVFVVVASWLRKRIGAAWWRRSHLLAVPAFTLSMVHGVITGTDSTRPWMWSIYLATGGIVLFLVIVRGLTVGLRPERAPRPAHAPAARPALRGGPEPAAPLSRTPRPAPRGTPEREPVSA